MASLKASVATHLKPTSGTGGEEDVFARKHGKTRSHMASRPFSFFLSPLSWSMRQMQQLWIGDDPANPESNWPCNCYRKLRSCRPVLVLFPPLC